MKTLNTLIITTLLMISGIISAHPNHGEMHKIEVSQSDIIEIAINKVNQKIEALELDDSWSSIESKKASMDRINGRQVWKVTLTQTKETMDLLNVFISKSGDYISISQ